MGYAATYFTIINITNVFFYDYKKDFIMGQWIDEWILGFQHHIGQRWAKMVDLAGGWTPFPRSPTSHCCTQFQ